MGIKENYIVKFGNLSKDNINFRTFYNIKDFFNHLPLFISVNNGNIKLTTSITITKIYFLYKEYINIQSISDISKINVNNNYISIIYNFDDENDVGYDYNHVHNIPEKIKIEGTYIINNINYLIEFEVVKLYNISIPTKYIYFIINDSVTINTAHWDEEDFRGVPGGKNIRKSLDKCTVKELKSRASKRNIKITGLNKAEIIAKLRNKNKK